ncbi:MAG TPA: aminopeptidase, partial [Candidatus Cloacimonadota bacterium]|nr:aminopeptidase [Candidatus Cloacimonadota bacterium]
MSINFNEMMRQLAAPKSECDALVNKMRSLQISPDSPFSEFFLAYRENVLAAWDFGTMIDADPELNKTPEDKIIADHDRFFAVMDPDTGYDKCLANPDFAHQLYGAEMGSLVSAAYMCSRTIRSTYLKRNFVNASSFLALFFDLYELALKGDKSYQSWLDAYIFRTQENFETQVKANHLNRFSPENDCTRKIMCEADLSDPRYLYRYGIYVGKHERAMAKFLAAYDAGELARIAKYIVQCFIDGFIRGKRDYRIKRYVSVIIPIGMEALGRLIVQELAPFGLEALVPTPMSYGINRQMPYDHRFDNALSLTRDYVEKALKVNEESMESMKDLIDLQAGPAYVELFGETPFSPVSKKTCLKLSDEQQQLFREFNGRYAQLYYKYYRRDESSFTIIAFPSTEIGDRFADIFADTLKINLLDSDTYARIQQHIINVLDTAEYVQVKGKPGNDTDIRVQMHKISDPATQTIFENCVADVNIPVGEVFTSPVLSGTTGTLHVEDIYLNDLRFFNLRMHFEDGWVKDYSCSNFEDPEEGKRYIHENLLLPHQSLPIGEFAIGTNTTAYQIAKKYDIMHLLPILIIEKMGPHFAIGDTCYSHEEDAPHPSLLNGKEMIAVENEKSATRK